MSPFESFTDTEVTVLSVPMIIDAFWENEYGKDVPPVAREVGSGLIYLVKKYGNLVPHWLLLKAVSEHTGLSESTVGPFIKVAEKLDMITAVVPDADGHQRLYGFNIEQKKKILRATNAHAYAAALAMQQAKQPTDTQFGRTPQNASYYRHIFNRINNINEDIVKKLTKLRQRIAWIIIVATGVALVLQPWATALASWSTGTTGR